MATYPESKLEDGVFEIFEMEEVPVIRAMPLLPEAVIEDIYRLLDESRPFFGTPSWSTGSNAAALEEPSRRSLCNAVDVWFPMRLSDSDQVFVPPILYEVLERYLLHPGIIEFCEHARQDVFRLLPTQSPNGKLHLVMYGNGGYYGWHRDRALPGGAYVYGSSPPRSNLFTFSLCLCRAKDWVGGDVLFMRNGKTYRVPMCHNSLVVFPASLPHAAAEFRMAEGEPWGNGRLSLQFWLVGAQSTAAGGVTDEKRWHK